MVINKNKAKFTKIVFSIVSDSSPTLTVQET